MEELGRKEKQSIGIQNMQIRSPYRRPQWPSFYRGPGLPKSMTDQIDPPEKTDVDLIFDSIRQIVETRPGERLQLPAFGSRIFELVGEPLTAVFEHKVKIFLTEAVQRYENRARLVSVSFQYVNHAVYITYMLNFIRLGQNAQSTFKIPRP